MLGIEQLWFEISIVLIPAAFILFLLRRKRLQARHDLERLSAALKAMEAHYRAVDYILADPAPSERIKDAIRTFSVAVAVPQIGKELAHEFIAGTLFERRDGEDQAAFKSEVADLRGRSDLVSELQTALLSGLAAILLRHRETEAQFISVMATISGDGRSRAALAAKVVNLTKGLPKIGQPNLATC